VDIHVLQIVLARALDGELVAVSGAAHERRWYDRVAGKIFAG
jgi:hypothetical protein